MRILVTGGTGFLGSRVALRLQGLGHHVTLVGRQAALAAPLASQGLSVLLTDLTEASATMRAVAGQDAVVHAAALCSPWGRYRDFYAANVLATRHIVDACIQHQVQRLVNISTPSIYVGCDQTLNISEDVTLPRRSINHYAATKWLAETEVMRGITAGLSSLTLRPQAIFGPGDKAIVPRLIRANSRTGIPLFGDGNHLIDVTYVDNVVDAVVLGLNASAEACGQAYNISNAEPIAFRSFMTHVLQDMGLEAHFRRLPLPLAKLLASGLEAAHRMLRLQNEPILTRYTLEVLTTSRTLNISRAQRFLGYAPRVTVAEGSRLFVAWWLAQVQR